MRPSGRHPEHGQVILIFIMSLTVIFVVGVLTLDVGIWLSERRGAQADADFSALAGAWELLDPNGTSADAVSEAEANLAANDDQGNNSLENPVLVDDSCWDDGTPHAVTVDVHHQSRPFFFEIFGLLNPSIGAHAKACVGAANGIGDVIPFQVEDDPGPCFDTNEEPIFTSFCPLELGAQGGNPRGMVDLEAPDGWCSDNNTDGDIENLIEFGAPGPCFINTSSSGQCITRSGNPSAWADCVAIQTGNPKKVLDGVNRRLLRDGDCDALPGGDDDGIDDFSESIVIVFDTGNPLTSIYEARDCDPVTPGTQQSPRLVTIIVLEEPPPAGNDPHPIVAFAGFYILGCAPEGNPVNNQSDTDPDCDAPGIQRYVPVEELFVSAPELGALPGPAACHRGVPHGQQLCPTATTTPTPSGGASATPTPSPAPSASPTGSPTPSLSPGPPGQSCGAPGHCVVWGQFVKLIVSGSGVGPPNDQTTLFGISLVE